MRIGVVGDTHNQLANVDQIVQLFADARVERVIHTGDITQPSVLERFARLDAPLVGVFGNNDLHTRAELKAQATEYGMDLVDPPRTIEWAGRRILVLHDPEEAPEAMPEGLDLLVHGHTHRHRHEEIDGTLVFNPGECAGFLAGRNAVGLIDLVTLEIERLHF